MAALAETPPIIVPASDDTQNSIRNNVMANVTTTRDSAAGVEQLAQVRVVRGGWGE